MSKGIPKLAISYQTIVSRDFGLIGCSGDVHLVGVEAGFVPVDGDDLVGVEVGFGFEGFRRAAFRALAASSR